MQHGCKLVGSHVNLLDMNKLEKNIYINL